MIQVENMDQERFLLSRYWNDRLLILKRSFFDISLSDRFWLMCLVCMIGSSVSIFMCADAGSPYGVIVSVGKRKITIPNPPDSYVVSCKASSHYKWIQADLDSRAVVLAEFLPLTNNDTHCPPRAFAVQTRSDLANVYFSEAELLEGKSLAKAKMERDAEGWHEGKSVYLPFHEDSTNYIARTMVMSNFPNAILGSPLSSGAFVTVAYVGVKGTVLGLLTQTKTENLSANRQLAKLWVEDIIAANPEFLDKAGPADRFTFDSNRFFGLMVCLAVFVGGLASSLLAWRFR